MLMLVLCIFMNNLYDFLFDLRAVSIFKWVVFRFSSFIFWTWIKNLKNTHFRNHDDLSWCERWSAHSRGQDFCIFLQLNGSISFSNLDQNTHTFIPEIIFFPSSSFPTRFIHFHVKIRFENFDLSTLAKCVIQNQFKSERSQNR